VPSLSPCCDWDLLAFLLLVFDCVRLFDVPKVSCANGGHPWASKEIVNSFCVPISYFTGDISLLPIRPPLLYLLPYPTPILITHIPVVGCIDVLGRQETPAR
jgi:hypothetical protein